VSGGDRGIRPRLVLVPGLGVDKRVFHPQAAAFPDLLIPQWLDPEPRESLPHYAERLAESVRAVARGPVVVGGLSLGGMLALEMARHLDSQAVVLIASCRSPRAICGPLQVAEHLGRFVPSRVVGWSLGLAPLFCGRGGGISPADRKLLGEIVSQVPVPLLRWGARAIMEWPGAAESSVPVHHVHGDHDWVLPLRCVQPSVIVRGGSHVLNLSNPDEVNDVLRKALSSGRENQ
jgi:pimeloyl-ACP methyl ester carboxylesterase